MDLILEKWNEILQTVKTEHELTDVSFNTWVEPLKVHSIKGNKLYILVPSEQIALNYIKKKFTLPIKVAVSEITNQDYEIEFILPEQAKIIQPAIKKQIPYDSAEKSNLNPNYTFDTFVVGSNNRFAHSASLAVAESPGEVYNPLFLYGGVGLGKTHLMHSIAQFIQAHNPELKVLYVSSETFTNELIDSIRNGNNTAMSKFREKYRNIDVLLVDDVQFIIGKESTQEEFFHTFNELHGAKKQIIISSDKPPKEIETLEERIRSRFEWGLLADIGSPDYETRMAILRRKEEVDGIEINDEILNYIANNVKSNIRELEGALNKLIAYSNLENVEITMDIAIKELQNIISPDKTKEVTPQLIIEVVSDHFQISIEQMISKNRSSEIARPRQIAMYLCKQMTDLPLDTIGSLLGGRDHSTIIHGIKKIAEDVNVNETTSDIIDTIKKKINPN
ncbi:MAG: chromosomal replication initiator protein DnaA [Lachnospiraceae bacterium]